MNKKDFPRIHFYDQDFVDIYDCTLAWVGDYWVSSPGGSASSKFFFYPPERKLDQLEQMFSSFFLVYSNRIYSASNGLDALYQHQEENGAIRWKYDIDSGEPVLTPENPEGITLPLFAWAEYNLYHKSANKKRVKEVMPYLQKYYTWIEENFKRENGLFEVPVAATGLPNSPRGDAKYLIDFNAAMAINALYMSALGDILNDKDISFCYKRNYFSLKTRINKYMWNADEGFYLDVDANEQQIKTKTIGGFWTLLAEIPNEERAEAIVSHLTNPKTFGTDNPFPSLAADSQYFNPQGGGACGSVYPHFTYMVIKGLERYNQWELARDCAIRHMYFILEGTHQNGEHRQILWEAYQPINEGKAIWAEQPDWPRAQYLGFVGLATVALMIENIIGLAVSLPRKTVDWIIPNLEMMGIENLSLKRNMVTILSNKSGRGWEIHMESEKLYYFTINIIGKKKKTLPIPSGKCSMLIEKI